MRRGQRLCSVLAVLALAGILGAGTVSAAPIVINKVRDLYFGKCDEVPGATYVVDAAEAVGGGACIGATSARFDLTGDANAKVKVTADKNVTVTNGVDSITVRADTVPSTGNISFDASGNLTIYIGGSFKIPQGGLASATTLSGNSILSVVYK